MGSVSARIRLRGTARSALDGSSTGSNPHARQTASVSSRVSPSSGRKHTESRRPRQLAQRGNAGQTVNPGATNQPRQHRFRLIIARVRRRHDGRAERVRALRQGCVADPPRGSLRSAAGLTLRDGISRHHFERRLRKLRRSGGRLAKSSAHGSRCDPVVDMHRMRPPARALVEVGQTEQQRRGIAAARQGDDQRPSGALADQANERRLDIVQDSSNRASLTCRVAFRVRSGLAIGRAAHG